MKKVLKIFIFHLCFQFDANENFFKLFEGSDKIVKISVNFDGFKK